MIIGKNFKSYNADLYLGTVPLNFKSSNDTHIILISPSMPPGSYSLIISSSSNNNILYNQYFLFFLLQLFMNI